MKSTQYSEKVLDHFRNPRNVGTLEGEDVAVGRVGNPVCGDLMEFYVKIKDNKIQDIKFKTFGCGSAIATASMITELAKGKTIGEALKITRQDVADELDGLPPIKMHCSNLAADALQDAIKNYQKRQQTESRAQVAVSTETRKVITGEQKYLNKGVFHAVDDLSILKDKRVIVIDKGDKSVETALSLTKYTPRVIFVTPLRETAAPKAIEKLKASNVKILYESEILEIKGVNEVEQIRIHDLNEDEEYDLFMDAIIILS